ncbi:MAG TPA: hypothetical protein VIV60_29875 [Polyangiaceae bacterium]
MKIVFSLLCVIGVGISVSCSSGSSTLDGPGAGGATSAGGTAGGGKTSAGGTVNATEVPVKNWDSPSAGAAGIGAGGSDEGPFGDLFDDPYYDPNDPCAVAIPWITGVNTTIDNGNLVQYLGKVYKYDTTNGSCNRQLTNMFDQCIPSAPADWCKPCWIAQDTSCP